MRLDVGVVFLCFPFSLHFLCLFLSTFSCNCVVVGFVLDFVVLGVVCRFFFLRSF